MGDDEAPDPKPTKQPKGALPFAEDAEALDGRAWNRKPLYVLGVLIAVAIAVVLLFLGFNEATGDDGGGGGGDVPPVTTTTTTVPPTTTSTTTTTTSTTAPPATTAIPTSDCSPEEGDPDCVDPDGDGSYEVIDGGASCLATAETPRDCIDTDNDGAAGPPAADD